MIEIERKFLVNSQDFIADSHLQTRIVQGFLNTHPDRTVRVRLKGDKGFLTVKGRSSSDGVSRFEWEKEISKKDAEALLKICETGVIDKIRYEVQVGDHVFEVDVFLEDNEGLIIAEVELNHQDEVYNIPKWLGQEVTGDERYYNSQLSLYPYKSWS
ncbi:CYTH domain-containing protein [Psychroserpens sp. SPM9]|uniref:CYTH domain-containing protein n=1 Tax=Psychroserpens sp. SPM9 TaxID=2975598 RepID=UPI0021A767AF|nr:CYTH domain-containing protein [Psychroserpens sp. SPM9]MDG5490950.1 CYTH domain-containing protein [Psychroserpens sp. SPM9]